MKYSKIWGDKREHFAADKTAAAIYSLHLINRETTQGARPAGAVPFLWKSWGGTWCTNIRTWVKRCKQRDFEANIAFWFVFHAAQQTDRFPFTHWWAGSTLYWWSHFIKLCSKLYVCIESIPRSQQQHESGICTKRKSGIATSKESKITIKLHPSLQVSAGFFRLGIVQPLLGRVEGTNTFTENPLWTTSQAVLSVHIARTRERGPPEYFQGYWPVRRKWSHSLPELVLQSSRRLKSSVLPQVSVWLWRNLDSTKLGSDSNVSEKTHARMIPKNIFEIARVFVDTCANKTVGRQRSNPFTNKKSSGHPSNVRWPTCNYVQLTRNQPATPTLQQPIPSGHGLYQFRSDLLQELAFPAHIGMKP